MHASKIESLELYVQHAIDKFGEVVVTAKDNKYFSFEGCKDCALMLMQIMEKFPDVVRQKVTEITKNIEVPSMP